MSIILKKSSIFFDQFPVIDLGDIILRQIEDSDSPEYFEYMNQKEMDEFLTNDNRPSTINDALKDLRYWKNLFSFNQSIYWAIALKDNNQIIGTIGFNIISFDHLRADVSYDLNPFYWGKGIMTNALDAVLKFSDYHFGIVRIQGTVITDNKRSIKLLEKHDFQKEGLLKKYEIVKGIHKDYFLYARILKT